MATEVKVPSMGESITSGILAAWHVKDGETVKQDQVLYELETDKITSEGMAEVDGKISLKVEEGEEVEIGQVVAVIEEGAEGSAPEEKEKTEAEDTEESDEDAEPSEETSGSESEADSREEDEEDEKKKDKGSKKPSHPSLSPAVRKLVEENNLDPEKIEGSGKDGRITKGDVQKHLKRAETDESEGEPAPEEKKQDKKVTTEKGESGKEKEQGETAPSADSAPSKAKSGDRVTRKKLSTLRKKIGERLVMAQRQAAILTTFNEVDMSRLMAMRTEHQDAFVEKHGLKLGFMSFFCKAVVHALKEVPNINAQIDGDTLIQNHYFDIGVAIGTDRGLIVPVLRDVDTLSFAEIENEIIRYATAAKEGKISVDDLQGGVFTISNGGVYGSLLSTPILNPPQSGILGMHTIQQRPVAIDGDVVIRPMMYLALSYDHRIVDGKEAVTFLVKVKEAVENPARLLFEI